MRVAPRRLSPLDGPLPWAIAWRFLRGRRTRLLDGTARAALTAIALGVSAMVIAMALMTGYREGLKRKLIGGNSALLVQPLMAETEPLSAETMERLEGLSGVERVGAVAYGRGVLSTGAHGAGVEVVLRGVDPDGGQLAARAEQLLEGEDGLAGVVLGAELAHQLGVEVGDAVRLMALGTEDGAPRFSYRSLRVTGSFETGFAEFDAEWAILARELVGELMGRSGVVGLYEFSLVDPREAPGIAERVRETVGPDYLVTDWRELNHELFTALAVQQRLLFLVLGLIVLVSTFNVASTLVVLVRERMRDIGALAAMGMPPQRLRAAFLLYGSGLGVVGTVLGVGIGAAVATLLDRYELIHFGAEVAAIYFIRSVPFHVVPGDLLAVSAFSLGVNFLACLIPAWWAAGTDPSRALRHE